MANAKMRIAIAGTNTLALMMAHFVITETSHQLVVLSRQVSPTYFLPQLRLFYVNANHDTRWCLGQRKTNWSKEQPHLVGQGYQVLVVNYEEQQSLRHAVMGVDTVISTVTGPPELQLLQASVAQEVRRFAPAEFEGRPSRRSNPDPLDRGKKT